jgi:hypothetical protein
LGIAVGSIGAFPACTDTGELEHPGKVSLDRDAGGIVVIAGRVDLQPVDVGPCLLAQVDGVAFGEGCLELGDCRAVESRGIGG